MLHFNNYQHLFYHNYYFYADGNNSNGHSKIVWSLSYIPDAIGIPSSQCAVQQEVVYGLLLLTMNYAHSAGFTIMCMTCIDSIIITSLSILFCLQCITVLLLNKALRMLFTHILVITFSRLLYRSICKTRNSHIINYGALWRLQLAFGNLQVYGFQGIHVP